MWEERDREESVSERIGYRTGQRPPRPLNTDSQFLNFPGSRCSGRAWSLTRNVEGGPGPDVRHGRSRHVSCGRDTDDIHPVLMFEINILIIMLCARCSVCWMQHCGLTRPPPPLDDGWARAKPRSCLLPAPRPRPRSPAPPPLAAQAHQAPI